MVDDVSGVKGLCRSPAFHFQYKIQKIFAKRGICEKQGGRNVIKCEYRTAIRTLLPDLSGRLLQNQGKLIKQLRLWYSSYILRFLMTKFLPWTPMFYKEINLFVKTFCRKTSQLQGRISGPKQKELFIITLCYKQTRALSDSQVEAEL